MVRLHGTISSIFNVGLSHTETWDTKDVDSKWLQSVVNVGGVPCWLTEVMSVAVMRDSDTRTHAEKVDYVRGRYRGPKRSSASDTWDDWGNWGNWGTHVDGTCGYLMAGNNGQ